MFKQGLICDINIEDGTARVRWMEDDVVSNWLALSVVRAGDFAFYCPFSINEQVWCILDDSGENGVIGGATYNKKMPTPQGSATNKLILQFGNNSTVTIDGESQSLTFDIEGDCSIKSKGDVTLEAEGDVDVKAHSAKIEAASVDIQSATAVKIKGTNVIIDAVSISATGTLTVTGAITAASIAAGGFSGISGGPMISNSNIQTSGDVIAGGKSLVNHFHTAPSGGGNTTPPV